MSPQFKKLYCQYIEKGITSSDIGKFRNELNNIPDEELWNTMIDMENDTVEIKMPPMMKKQIRKELQQIIWRRRWLQYMKYAAIIAIILSSSFGLYTWMNNPESQMVAVTVRAGSKAEMALPDGTLSLIHILIFQIYPEIVTLVIRDVQHSLFFEVTRRKVIFHFLITIGYSYLIILSLSGRIRFIKPVGAVG